MAWRLGRRVKNHLYRQEGAEPADTDPWIGSFVDPYDAGVAVAAVNGTGEALVPSDEAVARARRAAFEVILADAPTPPTIARVQWLADTVTRAVAAELARDDT